MEKLSLEKFSKNVLSENFSKKIIGGDSGTRMRPTKQSMDFSTGPCCADTAKWVENDVVAS